MVSVRSRRFRSHGLLDWSTLSLSGNKTHTPSVKSLKEQKWKSSIPSVSEFVVVLFIGSKLEGTKDKVSAQAWSRTMKSMGALVREKGREVGLSFMQDGYCGTLHSCTTPMRW